jgi:hypothetical protein
MMQSQVVEGTLAKEPKISNKELQRLEDAEKERQDPYYSIKIAENNNDEDIQCDVCLEFEYEDGDNIVICELCNAAVHQTCHGGDLANKIPNGAWYCERCEKL